LLTHVERLAMSANDQDPDAEVPDDDAAGDAAAAGEERREKLGEDVDTILDEIDDVLEERAEDFIRPYVQKACGVPEVGLGR
jgi:ubiquitin-like protein Pup